MTLCLVAMLVLLAITAPNCDGATVQARTDSSLVDLLRTVGVGDTVVLAAGTYAGAPHCGGAVTAANVTVVGAGPSATVINCTGSGLRGLSVTGSGATLAELAIVGGSACSGGSGGGNLLIESPGNAPGFTATLRNLVLRAGFVGDTAAACGAGTTGGVAHGGGLAAYSVANLAMSGVVLEGNVASSSESADGGGMYYVSWVPNQAVTLNFTDCTLASNSAVAASNATAAPSPRAPGAVIRGAQGGGARVWAGVAPEIDVIVTNSAVTNNMAQCTPNCNGFGGGMAMVGQNASFGSVGSTLTVDASVFEGNKAGGSECSSLGGCGGVGGALNTGMVTTITGSVLNNNAVVCSGPLSVAGSTCSAAGGAVFAQGVPFTSTSSSYDGNAAICTGNGCACGGAAISTISASPERFSGVNISNSLAECTGHACQATGAAMSVLNYAGGVPSIDVDVTVTNSVLVGNIAKATLTSCPTCKAGFIYGALGGAVFAQSVGAGHYTNVSVSNSELDKCQTATIVSAGEPGAHLSAELAKFPGVSTGAAVFALAYSGQSVASLSGCKLSGINSTCTPSGDQCAAGYPVLSGYGTVSGSVGGAGCVIADSYSPQLYASLADYDAGLVGPEFALRLGSGDCAVELSCPFLSRTLAAPPAGVGVHAGASARGPGVLMHARTLPGFAPSVAAAGSAGVCAFNATCSASCTQ